MAGSLPTAAQETVADRELLLRVKAELFRAQLLERHVSPEGLLLYRVDLQTLERDLREGTYPSLADTPTFNGIWAATTCARAGLEPDPTEALADATRALDGLALLMDVTGVRGLMARAVRRDAGSDTEGMRRDWHPGAEGLPNYVWRGDVSMDQYANGLLPAVAECAPHFPERARRLVTDFAQHLLDHDLQLIEPDGRRTRFGDLSPRSGFGLNTIAQMTAFGAFAWAARLDPEGPWARERDRLRDDARVVARGRRTNVRILGITNHSNDMMAWHLYRALIPLARETGDPALRDLRHGMARARSRVRPDGNAYFDALSCALEAPTCDPGLLERARDLLERFPLDKRQRLEPRSELADIPRRWIPGRKLERLARERVPIDLRPPSSFEWKSSPYRLERAGNPRVEYSGLDYLAAYWALAQAERALR